MSLEWCRLLRRQFSTDRLPAQAMAAKLDGIWWYKSLYNYKLGLYMNAFLILFSPYPHTRYSNSATEYLRKWMNDNSRDWVRTIVPIRGLKCLNYRLTICREVYPSIFRDFRGSSLKLFQGRQSSYRWKCSILWIRIGLKDTVSALSKFSLNDQVVNLDLSWFSSRRGGVHGSDEVRELDTGWTRAGGAQWWAYDTQGRRRKLRYVHSDFKVS